MDAIEKSLKQIISKDAEPASCRQDLPPRTLRLRKKSLSLSSHNEESHESEVACRRSKERRIDFVIEKVKLWRRLFNGYIDAKSGKLIRYSLEESARKVGLSKKSLDDYLLQIRFAKRFGFDFEMHKHDNIGVLRQFVKREKELAKLSAKADQGSSADKKTLHTSASSTSLI
jgi:hypothetical protein